jgi:Flp pilus assembly protein TadD
MGRFVCRLMLVLAGVSSAGCAGSLASRAEATPDERLSAAQALEIASVLEQRGDTTRAEQYLRLALSVGADERSVLPRLLDLYVQDGQYRLAVEEGESYLRRHPSDTRLRAVLASLQLAIGLEHAAAQQFSRVLESEPKNAEVHYALAALLIAQGRERGRADAHFRSYLELDPRGPHAEEARSLLLTELP